ncbi:MAG TPA: AMP-binding protein, partial [bacterium]|nr:AMP-binding protein [bacterium]
MLPEAERQQVLAVWNDTALDYPGICAHQLIEAQVRRSPQAVALRVEGREVLTYAELNARANRLARRLRELGLIPGALAAVALERSTELVVALLAVWKAGGVYVPLDPTHPAERLAYVLEDSGASVLLRRPGADLPVREGLVVVEVGASEEGDGGDLTPLAVPEALAYVIYTSGSTGRPKGVEVRHGGLVSFLTSMRREPGLGSSDVLLAVTTVSFDIAGLELYLPLAVGAQVLLASHETAMDGVRLAAALAGATVLQATPATWRLLLESGWQGTPGLKALCGGEALPRDLAREISARVGSLWNLYGPTETTIWSMLRRVDDELPETAGTGVSIGRPIANTSVHLLGRHLELVPMGAVGEICIGGAGLARGYLG